MTDRALTLDELLNRPKELKEIVDAAVSEMLYDHIARLQSQIEALKIEAERLKKVELKYQELILQVDSKYFGESRHETALRYIRERETSTPPAKGGSGEDV